MDAYPIRLIRPMSALLYASTRRHVFRRGEWLTAPNVEILNTCAYHDHVNHPELLQLLSEKMKLVLSSSHDRLTGVHRAGAVTGVSEGNDNDDDHDADDDDGGAGASFASSVLPRKCAGKLLQAVHHCPISTAALQDDVEGLVVDHVLRHTPPDVDANEVGELWGILTQCTSWASMQRILAHYPLCDTLHLQSVDGLQGVLAAIAFSRRRLPTAAEHDSLSSSGTLSSTRLLRDVIGEERVWQLCRQMLTEVSAPSATEARQRVVPTCAAICAALYDGEPPDSRPPPPPLCGLDEAFWQFTVPSLRTTAAPSFFVLGRLVASALDPHVPPHLRTTLRPAFIGDVERLAGQGDVHTAVLFCLVGVDPVLAGTSPTVRQQFLPYLREVVEAAWASFDATAATRLAPSREVWLTWLMLVTLLECDAAVQEEVAARVLRHLQQTTRFVPGTVSDAAASFADVARPLPAHVSASVPSTPPRSSLSAFPDDIAVEEADEPRGVEDEERDGGNRDGVEAKTHTQRTASSTAMAMTTMAAEVDLELWEYWHPLFTVYLALAGERLFFPSSTTTTTTAAAAAALSSSAAVRGIRTVWCDVCRRLLSESVLRERGSPRMIALLLRYAPLMTRRELAIEPVCVQLLQQHMMDGFTHQQLSILLPPQSAQCALAPASGADLPWVDAEMRARLEEAVSCLPQRR